MTAAELVKINSLSMELMSRYDIRQDDYRFVGMYDEYRHLKGEGEKYWYIIARLAEKYGISESSVKRLIRRLSREVRM